ncbi:DUF1767 domain-containing protein [Cephalotus follicularis]|uniref:DUF1767 domain-containing protein n=1 Tax=Cephalotus follicularis TaxID=3775 RepID=A0A1Q3D8Z2_CEPFO|nr:DUF1767 domain-containing protein [Cephalotus follicularis]
MESSTSTATEAVIETLKSRGWCLGDIDQVKALVIIQSALLDDTDTFAVSDSVESELLNMDLRSIGAKSLPEPTGLRNKSTTSILGPIILQISSVRDISVNSMERFSKNSSKNKRLLRLGLTDGHTEITAIEYSQLPLIPDDVVPGTKVRLENKVIVRSGIACLNPKVISLLGGVVQSLYEEWQMNQKYLAISGSSLRPKQESDAGGPPQFEMLQVGPPSHRSSNPGPFLDYSESTSKNSGPSAVRTIGKYGNGSIKEEETSYYKRDSAEIDPETAPLPERTEEKPSSSTMRPKEVAEAVPVQNQAAAQKLLQKMSHPNRGDNKHSRGQKHRGKGKQEEQQVFTLAEFEKRKAGEQHWMNNELPETSHDEHLAWQLQNQLDLEDSHVPGGTHNSDAEYIKLSMFNYERDNHEMEHRGRGKGRGRGRGKGRGRGGGRSGKGGFG